DLLRRSVFVPLAARDDEVFGWLRHGRPPREGPPPLEAGALLAKKLPKHRTVAVRLVLAITAHREVRVVRQRGEQLDGVRVLRLRHLRAGLPGERRPLGRRRGLLRLLHRLDARRQVRKPDVVPVARRELRLRHAPRRAAHRADSQALVDGPVGSETDYANDHGFLIWTPPVWQSNRLGSGSARTVAVLYPACCRSSGSS